MSQDLGAKMRSTPVLNFDQSGCIILIHDQTHDKNVICHTIHFPTTNFPSGKQQHKGTR